VTAPPEEPAVVTAPAEMPVIASESEQATRGRVTTASGIVVLVIDKGPAWRRLEALNGSVLVESIRPAEVDAWLAEH